VRSVKEIILKRDSIFIDGELLDRSLNKVYGFEFNVRTDKKEILTIKKYSLDKDGNVLVVDDEIATEEMLFVFDE
jgi:hypothetical protein